MDTAQKTFEINNNVKLVDPIDDVYLYPRDLEKALEDRAPWKTDPHYFTTVKISAVALIKMVTHARSGGDYEIMGVMYGRVRDCTFWITDAAALPVQGTETRVNAGNEAFEYMVQFQSGSNQVGKSDLLRGWYHSHPGYGCWLSGIDVGTQSTNQKFNDPYLAVVIDPNRTVSAGKVEIGAFRTYPEGYTPPESSSQYQSVPMDKLEDFGVHADQYYPLKVEVYKTRLDEQLLSLLWNKYWVATLSQSLIASYATSQLRDLSAKLSTASAKLGDGKSVASLKRKDASMEKSGVVETGDAGKGKGKKEAHAAHGVEAETTFLGRAAKDASRITAEAHGGLVAQVVKDKLFNTPLGVRIDDDAARRAAQGLA